MNSGDLFFDSLGDKILICRGRVNDKRRQNLTQNFGSSSICVEVVPARLAKLLIRRTNFDQVASVLRAAVAHDESTELPNSIKDFVLEATRWFHTD
jgi:hypothetical protein